LALSTISRYPSWLHAIAGEKDEMMNVALSDGGAIVMVVLPVNGNEHLNLLQENSPLVVKGFIEEVNAQFILLKNASLENAPRSQPETK
jgi:hypothetical protein